MEAKIEWRKDFDKAKSESKMSGKFLFLFFHHPECGGCEKTIKETFEDGNVIKMIGERFIPMMFSSAEDKDLACKYAVEWTPTFIIADDSGNELDRWDGFLPSEEFIPQAILAEGLAHYRKQNYKEAISSLSTVVYDYSKSGFTPQATYYLGICQYKDSEEPSHLEDTYRTMYNRYPESYWTKKASPWAA